MGAVFGRFSESESVRDDDDDDDDDGLKERLVCEGLKLATPLFGLLLGRFLLPLGEAERVPATPLCGRCFFELDLRFGGDELFLARGAAVRGRI
jgi:hypothetical protein|tara:strand:- start:388 stop:669 length:282 start_codon:yes stop_codon:yes gene_type:complete